MQDIGVIRNHDRDDRYLRLYSEVESTLLKRQQIGLCSVRSRALWEYVDALLILPHDFRGAVEGEFGGLAVAAVDEHGFTKGH